MGSRTGAALGTFPLAGGGGGVPQPCLVPSSGSPEGALSHRHLACLFRRFSASGDMRANGDKYLYEIQLSSITSATHPACAGANICQVKPNDQHFSRKVGTSDKTKYYIQGDSLHRCRVSRPQDLHAFGNRRPSAARSGFLTKLPCDCVSDTRLSEGLDGGWMASLSLEGVLPPEQTSPEVGRERVCVTWLWPRCFCILKLQLLRKKVELPRLSKG